MSPRALLLLLVLLSGPTAAPVPAQEDNQPARGREVARTTGLSQAVYERMQEIQALIEAGDVDQAERRLQALQEEKLSDYELAQTWFIMGYVHFQREEFGAAQAAYEKVLRGENLPLGMQTNVLRTLAQLSMVNEDYAQALGFIERFLAIAETPMPEIHALKAQAHYQLDAPDQALAALEDARRLAAEAGDPPKENWLLLKNAILYQREDFAGMLEVVRELVRLYPRDRYLLNMAAIYGEMGEGEKQLSLLEPLYERGGLSSANHKINLASLYLLNEVPYKAAVLLERELESGGLEASEKHLEMLAQAWMAAANLEAALEPLTRAAELAEDGATYLTLARTYMSLARWEEAERSAELALDKGGLRDVAGARILRGMALFNQKRYRDARAAFARAGEDPEAAALAERWMNYLEREEEKQALLREAEAP